MSGATSIPALIRYAMSYGYKGAALGDFVKQRYQEEEEERRLELEQEEEDRLEELKWEEEMKWKKREYAIKVSCYDFQISECNNLKALEKKEYELIENSRLSTDEIHQLLDKRRQRFIDTQARMQMAECAMLEQLKNLTIFKPALPTPATIPDTPNLPQAEDLKNHVVTLPLQSDTVLDCTAKQEPCTQNMMNQQSKDTSPRYRETSRLLYSWCAGCYYQPLSTDASPVNHPTLSFDKSLSVT
jgi:hypothetical protein